MASRLQMVTRSSQRASLRSGPVNDSRRSDAQPRDLTTTVSRAIQRGKTWAAIFTRADSVLVEPDPHWATVAVRIGDLTVVSSVLPWRSHGPEWGGSTMVVDLHKALAPIRAQVDEATVWGGDWNQALECGEYVGTLDGRKQILELLDASRLSVPTRSLGSATPGHRSIDHIAVPVSWDVDAAYRVPAKAQGQRLSDHDMYVISANR